MELLVFVKSDEKKYPKKGDVVQWEGGSIGKWDIDEEASNFPGYILTPYTFPAPAETVVCGIALCDKDGMVKGSHAIPLTHEEETCEWVREEEPATGTSDGRRWFKAGCNDEYESSVIDGPYCPFCGKRIVGMGR